MTRFRPEQRIKASWRVVHIVQRRGMVIGNLSSIKLNVRLGPCGIVHSSPAYYDHS